MIFTRSATTCSPGIFRRNKPSVVARNRSLRTCCNSSADSSHYGLILENDGVLLDAHQDGHREAFNRAFSELGYDCVQWSPVIYDDLLRWGDGTGPGLIKAYFSRLGWPIMLGSKDRPAFVEKVYEAKIKHLKDMVQKGDIPLRSGVKEFIDEALADGCKIVVLAGTSSAPQDSILSSAMLNLGPNRAVQLQTVTVGVEEGGPAEGEGGEPAAAGGGTDGPPAKSLSFEQQIAVAQAEAKKEVAMSFVKAMHLKGVGLGLDPALQAAAERVGLVSPALLAAIIATLGVSMDHAVMVAANHSTMEASKSAGMLTAAAPPSLSARGGYSAADMSFDGFGPGGGVTWRKLKSILQARLQKQQQQQ